jgi:hypothetical protein
LSPAIEQLAVTGQFVDAVGECSAGEQFELAPEVQAGLATELVAFSAQLPDLGACQFKVGAGRLRRPPVPCALRQPAGLPAG